MHIRLRRTLPVFLLPSLVACAAHTSGLQARAAATDMAIRQARVSLDSAVQAGSGDRLKALFAADSFSAAFGSTDFSRASLAATFDSLTGGRPPKAIILTPAKTDYCLAGGFETGRYTFASSRLADSTASRNGTYAIAWTTSNGTALVRTVLLDTARDTRRMQSAVRCQPWKVQRLRSSPLLLAVTPVYERNTIQSSIYSDAQAAGWKSGWIDGRCSEWHGKSDYANRESAPDRSSAVHNDAVGLLIGARLRVGERNEIEVQGSTRANSSCMVALNRSAVTAVTTFMDSRWYGAYVSRSFGDLRVGVGPTLRHITTSVGDGGTVGDPVTKNLVGAGTVMGYTVPLGQRAYADLSARLGMTSSYTMEPEGGFTPKTVRPRDYLVGVSLGWSR